jgi:hypothetical protein
MAMILRSRALYFATDKNTLPLLGCDRDGYHINNKNTTAAQCTARL